jgi:excisionase family DNA binding protein
MPNGFNTTDWITTKEAAKLTGYKVKYLRQLISQGRLEAQKLGRDWFLNKAKLLSYADEMKHLGPAKHDPWRTGARQKKTED